MIPGVRHQDVRPENFSFVQKGVLFIGINLPGEVGDEPAAWATRLEQNATWIDANFERFGQDVRAAVIFAQATLSDANALFFVRFRAVASRFAGPVLYLHAEGHTWLRDQPWPEDNILRVQADRIGVSRPLLISVASEGDGVEIFQFDRRYRRGPYLASGGSDHVTIVWRTFGMASPLVRIGRRPGKLKRRIRGRAILSRRADGKGQPESLSKTRNGAVQYEALVNRLKPDTRYYYGIYDGKKLIAGADADHGFRTSPEAGTRKPFRFWVVGDSGTGGQSQFDVHRAMREYIRTDRKPLDFYMHVGDMAYSSGTDREFQHHFFEPYDETLRNTVCWPTMGNHEGISSSGKSGVGPYYDSYVLPTGGEVGGVPSGTEAYYSFDYANAHFICLDSHDLDRSRDGAMAQWLKADLAATKADWIMAYWHHPPYSKGTHDSDVEAQLVEMRQHIMPILEDAGVDVVFTGHSHVYERSMLMDGAYETPTVAENFILDDGDGDPEGDGAYRKSSGNQSHQGTVQVVTGHGGASVGRVGTMPVMRSVFVEHGSVLVDVDGDELTAVMINKDGLQRDIFSLVKQGSVVPKRIANPWRQPFYMDWGRLEAVASLKEFTPIGAPAEFTFTIPALPLNRPLDGRIRWQTNDTSWTVSPATTNFTMEPDQETLISGNATHGKNIFPLAVPVVTIITADGEGQARGALVMPPYKQTTIRRMAALPTIDGILDDAELAGLTRQNDMIEHNGKGATAFPCEFYLGIYEDHLYFAIHNQEPEMDKLVFPERERDGQVWLDSSNELFLQLAGEPDYYQIIVAGNGQVFDMKLGENVGDAAWTGDFASAVHQGEKGWGLEVLFAPGLFGRPLQSGDKLRLNITRNNPIHDELSQWSHTFRKGNHRLEFFGTAVIE
jgi:hypothetical protein